jgi:Flp pilus assembly protein CpaB
MKIKTVLLLAVAVGCGTAGSRMAKRLLSRPHEERAEETVVVLAAKQPLPAGTIIRDPDRVFEERTVAKSQAPGKSIKKLSLLRGRRLIRNLEAQALVTTESLEEQEREGLELLKKEGRQAVVITVAPLGSELLPPEPRVDVVLATPGGSIAEAPIIAGDLPLLGVEQSSADSLKATLAATPEDAQKLERAAGGGNLRLRLRQPR